MDERPKQRGNRPDDNCYLPSLEEIARECELLRASRIHRYAKYRTGEVGAIREYSSTQLGLESTMELGR
jgi:hypothetical protein